MNEITVWFFVVFAFGTGMFVYGHFFLYRNAMRLKRKQEAKRAGQQPDAGAKN